MNTKIDQRHTPRVSFIRPAVLALDQKIIHIATEDISMGGILIQSSESIETGKDIEIVIRYSKDREIQINVRKIWSILFLADNLYCWQMGNLITNISPTDQNLLASLILDKMAEFSYPTLPFHSHSQ